MWNKRKLIAVFIVVIIAVVAGFSVVQADVGNCTVTPERNATGVSIYTNVTASCVLTGGEIKLYEGEPSPVTEVTGQFNGTDTFTPTGPLKPYTLYTACVNLPGEAPNLGPQQITCDYKWTFTTGGPVGGLTYPNRTASLLAPWMALAALGFSLLGGGLALRKRMS